MNYIFFVNYLLSDFQPLSSDFNLQLDNFLKVKPPTRTGSLSPTQSVRMRNGLITCLLPGIVHSKSLNLDYNKSESFNMFYVDIITFKILLL